MFFAIRPFRETGPATNLIDTNVPQNVRAHRWDPFNDDTMKRSLYRVLTSRLRIAVLTADVCSSRVVYSKRNCVSASVTPLLLVCAMQEDIIDARLTSFITLRKKIFLG